MCCCFLVVLVVGLVFVLCIGDGVVCVLLGILIYLFEETMVVLRREEVT